MGVKWLEDISRDQGFVHCRVFVLVELLKVALPYVNHVGRVWRITVAPEYLQKGCMLITTRRNDHRERGNSSSERTQIEAS
jgi:hypothetical protein